MLEELDDGFKQYENYFVNSVKFYSFSALLNNLLF